MQRRKVEAEGRARTYLYPGRIFASAVPHQLATVLGSCVSVCLWDPETGVGGMNHFLLPEARDAGAERGRFGNLAVDLLLEKVVAEGARPGSLRAKLFGGACVLQGMDREGMHLGAKNVEAARLALGRHGIRVEGEDVGGAHGRKLIFHTDDGGAWVKLL